MSGSNKKRRHGRRDNQPGPSQKEKSRVPSNLPPRSLLIKLSEDAPTWYELGSQTPGRDSTILSDPPPSGLSGNTKALIAKYRSQADDLYRIELQAFGRQGDDKDMAWIQSTISKGTLKDRIAAMSVVVTSHPVHKFHALDGLLQMAGCLSEGQANSRVAQLAAGALQDLFINTFLPSNRKLIGMAQRPLYLYEHQAKPDAEGETDEINKDSGTKRTLSPRVLLLWRFEEMVKEKYHLFLSQYVGQTLREGAELQKIPTLRLAAELLKSVPEGESIILPMITNKLGDPDKKVPAAAGHELRKVLYEHPAMQTVVAREVQQLAHRPQLSSTALYNCITFLNQLRFDSRDSSDEAKDTIDTKKNKNGRVPDAASQSLPASLISTYFRLFEITVQKATKDPGTNSMKGRLLSALLSGVNRAHPYLPAKDQEMEEHVDALYRVVHKAPPSACTQALLLLFHLAVGSKIDGRDKETKTLSDQEKMRQERFYETLYSRLSHAELLRSGKHLTMLFNLIFKAMKYDTNATRVITFAKQVLSTTMHCSPAIVAAILFLLNEVSKFHPLLARCFSETLDGPDSYRCIDFKSHNPLTALVVKCGDEENFNQDENIKLALIWEISMLLKHHHPSVARFASNMGSLDYAGDPLKDFALTPFLDKFAYRNPKSTQRIEEKIERNKMSVTARHSGTESLVERQSAIPVNDPSFLEKKNIAVEDEFFHLFFSERAKRDEIKGIERHPKDEKTRNQGEEAAMDKLESKEFEAYEQSWESDEEEEAFVDELAQKIIDDSINANELGPGDLDGEDPDMTGWDDLHDDEDSDKDDDDEDAVKMGDSDSDVDLGQDEERGIEDDDDDAFMEKDTEYSSESDEEAPELANLDDEGVFEETEDSDGEKPVDESDQEAALAQALAESDSEDFEDENTKKSKDKQKKAKIAPVVYASAKDYEDRINDAWNRLKDPVMVEDPPLATSKKSENEKLRTNSKHKKKRRKSG